MWKGRFAKETSHSLREFGESVSYDWRLFAEDVAGSIAHARGLLEIGILEQSEFSAIERGLQEIREEIARGEFRFDPSLEDVHMNIEAELTRRIGAAGAKLHTARSRNDQVATDFRLYLMRIGAEIQSNLRVLQRALLDLAKRSQNVLIPGYTHLQRAQPVFASHHLLAYVEMLERDRGRFQDAVVRMNVCPLGSGAIAGSTIALPRESVAAELGFNGVTKNSMDAVASRDFACEFLAASAILGMHLSRLCEDLILWSSAEFRFLQLDDAHTTGSSLMPQKKNPDIAELVRGKSGRLYGNLVALLTTMKGLPMTYNRDMQEDKEPVFDSADTLLRCLPLMAEMLQAAGFHQDSCADAVADPLLLATDLADHLVLRGIPFRQAHEMVGRLVAESVKTGTPLPSLNDEIFTDITGLAPGTWRSVFDLKTAMNARCTTGSPGPEKVASELDRWIRHCSSDA